MQCTHTKNTTHTSIKSVLSLASIAFSAFFVGVRCVFQFFNLRRKPCMQCVRQVGNQPLHCRSPQLVLWKGMGRVCWSMWSRSSVWTSVGRSVRVLNIVTQPILAVSCSSQHLKASIFNETAHATLGFYIVSCQRSLFPVSCHEIWNRTQYMAVIVTSERLDHWIVT